MGVHGFIMINYRLEHTDVPLFLSALDPPLTFVRVAGQQGRREGARWRVEWVVGSVRYGGGGGAVACIRLSTAPPPPHPFSVLGKMFTVLCWFG